MYTNGTHSKVIPDDLLSSPQYPRLADAEGEILFELEQKRRQLDNDIANFREQKEREFKDFERELRSKRRRKGNVSPPLVTRHGRQDGQDKPPSRTSSSSALNLLAGRAAAKSSQSKAISKTKALESSSQVTAKAGASVSQPVVSLDKLNIKGETAVSAAGRPRTPPTPILLSKTLSRSSSSSSIAASPPRSKKRSSPSTDQKSQAHHAQSLPREAENLNTLSGLFTSAFISPVDPKANSPYESSALETPPAEDEIATAPSSYKSNALNEVLAVASSSFPPHVTMSPGSHNHVSKRAYTAPTVSPSRIPSALRTASGVTLGRKAKHVTFRLADSAIVEPSSSYEEGLSPRPEDEKESKSPSGTRSPLRHGKSQLHRTLSPDEEDAEAGVKPGMGMGDVIQRLNEYTIAEAAKNGEDLALEIKNKQESEDEDDDLPMEMPTHHQDDMEDSSDKHLTINYHEHEDEDGYFSPNAKHVSTMSPIPRGNSPLTPYRDGNWAELSSSDKDRLLFETRRYSDDGDDAHKQSSRTSSSVKADQTGFHGGLKHSIDGGSGVGFFELDEELASPEAGQAKPFEFDNDADDIDAADAGTIKTLRNSGLGLSITTSDRELAQGPKAKYGSEAASKFGVGSVPIDIVRPSLSVSSSWVGTFGH